MKIERFQLNILPSLIYLIISKDDVDGYHAGSTLSNELGLLFQTK